MTSRTKRANIIWQGQEEGQRWVTSMLRINRTRTRANNSGGTVEKDEDDKCGEDKGSKDKDVVCYMTMGLVFTRQHTSEVRMGMRQQ